MAPASRTMHIHPPRTGSGLGFRATQVVYGAGRATTTTTRRSGRPCWPPRSSRRTTRRTRRRPPPVQHSEALLSQCDDLAASCAAAQEEDKPVLATAKRSMRACCVTCPLCAQAKRTGRVQQLLDLFMSVVHKKRKQQSFLTTTSQRNYPKVLRICH